jgi:hypothetical protein
VIENLDRFLDVIRNIYAGESPPRPFLLLPGIQQLQAGEDSRELVRAIQSTTKRLTSILQSEDPIDTVLKCNLPSCATEELMRKARRTLGQLLLGELAERAFEKIYDELWELMISLSRMPVLQGIERSETARISE